MKFIPVCSLVLFLSAQVHADTVFQGGTFGSPVSGLASDAADGEDGTWQAVQFTLPTGINITDITVEGIFLSNIIPATDDFSLAFFQDSGLSAPDAVPGALLALHLGVASTRTAVGSAFGATLFQFGLDPSVDIALAPGTYWLAVANNTPSNGSTLSWAWTASNGSPQHAESSSGIISGYTSNAPIAFAYSFQGSVVPEPTSAALLCSLGLLALARRRR